MSNGENDLFAALAEVRQVFPDWRFGQLIGNLVQAAGLDSDGALWEVEDDQLLAAARRLIERNQTRSELPAGRS
jgi:hypothetical protein